MKRSVIVTVFVGAAALMTVNADAAPAPSNHISRSVILSGPVSFWVWTPETNKWVNPKYSVKETPQEQLQVGIDFYRADRFKEAVREFQKLIKHYPQAREAPDAQYHIGLSFERQGALYRAFKEFQLVIDKYPFSELAGEIVRRQYDIGLALLDDKSGRNKFVDSFSGTDYSVIDVFRAVIKNAPYGELAAPAQYKIGLYLHEKKLFQEARDELEKVINDYPGTEWAKAAKYQLAVSDAQRSSDAPYDQKVTQAAVEEFKEFTDHYPDAELSAKAKEHILRLREKEAKNNYLIAEYYEKQKNFKAAKIYYQVIVDDFKSSSWSVRALNKVREMSEKQ